MCWPLIFHAAITERFFSKRRNRIGLAARSDQQKNLDALLNSYSAGKISEQEYTAARDKILSGVK